jgi:hypothetical protein
MAPSFCFGCHGQAGQRELPQHDRRGKKTPPCGGATSASFRYFLQSAGGERPFNSPVRQRGSENRGAKRPKKAFNAKVAMVTQRYAKADEPLRCLRVLCEPFASSAVNKHLAAARPVTSLFDSFSQGGWSAAQPAVFRTGCGMAGYTRPPGELRASGVMPAGP